MLHNRLAQLREERAEGDRGFTLIELLVVVVIIGILIAIAIPLYLNYKKGANDSASESDARGAITAIEACATSGSGTYPTSMTTTQAAAVTFPTTTSALVPCSGQQINLSSGTSLNYIAGTSGANYALATYSSSGNTTSTNYWCYSSVAGGSVHKSSNVFPTTAAGVANFTC